MLEHLNGIKWVGDLSLQDADLLAMYGRKATRVLEHGSGGSTMILAQTAQQVISLEDNVSWNDVITQRLRNLNLDHKVTVLGHQLSTFINLIKEHKFDLVFVDGAAKDRVAFIQGTWNSITDGSYILIHDSRYYDDKHITWRGTYRTDLVATEVLRRYPNQIGEVIFNAKASDGQKSNITIIRKEIQPVYENWQALENKPSWSYGSDQLILDQFWEYN